MIIFIHKAGAAKHKNAAFSKAFAELFHRKITGFLFCSSNTRNSIMNNNNNNKNNRIYTI
jgi:hypothetical protein